MKIFSDPIGVLGRLNASLLLLFTPEYKWFRKLKSPKAVNMENGTTKFSMKPEYKSIDGVDVRYSYAGKEDAPTILLLSPLPQSILCYDLIWNKLATNFQVYALDMPGFGKSKGGVEFMSFEAQGKFLEKFINEMNLKDVHIVGPDIGMPSALSYVIHQKHEVASLILGDGPSISPSFNGSIINKAVKYAFWRIIFSITGAKAFVEGGNKLGYLNYIPNNQEVKDYVESYDGRISIITQWFKNYPKSIDTIDPYIDSIDIPVQIFWGEQDIFLLSENAKGLDKRLAHSKLTIFKNCGHFSYQDSADEFVEMLIDWVNGGYLKV